MNVKYNISLQACVTVNTKTSTVVVDVPLSGLASELQYALEYVHPNEITTQHEEIINAYMTQSLEHHNMRHVMQSEVKEGK